MEKECSPPRVSESHTHSVNTELNIVGSITNISDLLFIPPGNLCCVVLDLHYFTICNVFHLFKCMHWQSISFFLYLISSQCPCVVKSLMIFYIYLSVIYIIYIHTYVYHVIHPYMDFHSCRALSSNTVKHVRLNK